MLVAVGGLLVIVATVLAEFTDPFSGALTSTAPKKRKSAKLPFNTFGRGRVIFLNIRDETGGSKIAVEANNNTYEKRLVGAPDNTKPRQTKAAVHRIICISIFTLLHYICFLQFLHDVFHKTL